jgi:PncC family amidohydrolase
MDPELVALAERLQGACIERGLTVATAESCTGGLIGHALTEVPGSSGYVRGGVIAYADDVKATALGVPWDALQGHGAVSAQVAIAMANGVRASLGTSIGIAVTGIAGPGGATATKPVGTTYVAVAGPFGSEVRRHHWTGDRHDNKERSAAAALVLLLEVLGVPAPEPRGPGAAPPGPAEPESPAGATEPASAGPSEAMGPAASAERGTP